MRLDGNGWDGRRLKLIDVKGFFKAIFHEPDVNRMSEREREKEREGMRLKAASVKARRGFISMAIYRFHLEMKL